MTAIKIIYNQIAPVIKVTYDINEVYVGGENAAPIYVSVDYASSVASGNVSSVGLSMPTGFTVTGSPITTAGTFIVNVASGYLIPTQAMFDAKVPYTGATGNVNLGEFGVRAGYLQVDTTPTNTPTDQGTMYWDDNAETVALIMNGTIQKVGEDVFFHVKNQSGSSIPKGTAVMFAGTDGNSGKMLIAPFLADGTYPSQYFMGVTSEVIANGDEGKVFHFGKMRGINTSAFQDGDLLYASTTVAGGFQTAVPVAPNNIILVAAVINAANNGVIMIRPSIGSNINNDEGVKITNPTNGQVLKYNSTSGLWENSTDVIGTGTVTSVAATAGTGISITGSPITTSGTLNITNTAPDQIVSLTGTGTTTITGTYPNFTINSDDQFDGTVTSIATSSPLTGGTITTSGTIGITQSSGSTDGYLSSGDWNTFNSKQPALNGTGFVKISGTTISYDNNTYYLASNPSAYIALTNLSAGTGMSYDNTTGVITNALPDQVVSLTGSGTTSISGTYPNFTITSADQYLGTVTSVAASVPTGFTIGGSPVTSSGTLAIGFASGYSLPTDAKQTDWDTAYTNRITSLTTSGNSGAATLVSNTLNIPNYTLSGLGGEPAITAGTSLQYWRGDKTFQTLDTLAVAENTNLYFTADRVRNTLLTGLNLTAGGTIAATDSVLQAFGKVQNQISALVGGVMYAGTWNASTNSPSLTSSVGTKGNYYIVTTAGNTNLDGITDWKIGDWAIFNGSTWDKVDNTDAVSSVNGYTGAVSLVTDDIPEAGSPVNLYFTQSRARTSISLTTSGSSGAATYSNTTGVLNVPNYTLSGLGGVPSTRTLTINGTGYDLSADRSWSVGTVTSVAALTIGTTGTDITSTVANGTTTPVITLNIPTASATNRGALSSTDWSTFNNKQAQLNGTGFVKASGTTITYDNSTYYLASNPNSYIALTALSASAPLSYNNSTGAFTISQASGTTNGYLSSTDWTTFNNKQNALTNPVTGTGTSGYLTKWTGSTTVGNSIINDDGFSAVVLLDTAGEFQIKVATALKLVMYGNSTNGIINTPSGVALKLQTDSTDRLTIASTGAATFSSSVTASSIIKSGGTSSQYLMADGSTSTLTNPVTGTGTSGFHVKWTGTNTVGNSIIDDDGFGASVALGTGGAFNIKASGSIRLAMSGTSTHGVIDTPSGIGLKLQTDAVDRLTIASTGAATFSSSVTAGGAIKSLAALQTGNSSGNPTAQFAASGGNTYLDYEGDLNIRYNFGALNVATFSSSGNLGLGVTPSAWGSNFKALEYNGGVFYAANTEYGNAFMGSNAYFDGSNWRYKTTNGAAYYEIQQNKHFWNIAPSGTAGNAITFTQAMTLTSGGNLLVNTTNDVGSRVYVNGQISSTTGVNSGDGTRNINLHPGADFGLGANPAVQVSTNHALQFATNNSLRMLITSGGNVGIGTTSPVTNLHVQNGTSANTLVQIHSYGSEAAGEYAGVLFKSAATNLNEYAKASILFRNNGTGYGRGDLYFNINNAIDAGNATSSDVKMVLDASGRLGVGTTSPSEKLDVRGKGYFNNGGEIYIDSNATNTILATTGARPLILEVNGSPRQTIASNGAVTFSSTIKTAAPTGGTAKPWKLGNKITGGCGIPSDYATFSSYLTDTFVEVEVDGTTYYLPIFNTSWC